MPKSSENDSHLSDLIDRIADDQVQAKVLDKRIKKMRDEAHELMKRSKLDFFISDYNTINIIRPMRTSLNEQMLEDSIGSDVFDTVTVRVVDKGLLADAMANGVISGDTVAGCTFQEPLTYYVKVTPGKTTPKDDGPNAVCKARPRSEAAKKIKIPGRK